MVFLCPCCAGEESWEVQCLWPSRWEAGTGRGSVMQDLQDCQRNGKCQYSMWLPRALMEGSESWLHDGSEGSGTPLKRRATMCACNCVSVQKKRAYESMQPWASMGREHPWPSTRSQRRSITTTLPKKAQNHCLNHLHGHLGPRLQCTCVKGSACPHMPPYSTPHTAARRALRKVTELSMPHSSMRRPQAFPFS